MIRILFFYFLLIISNKAFSQSLSKNYSFEMTTSEVFCKNPFGPDNESDFSPFATGKIENWQASHGSPQVNISKCNPGDNDVFYGQYSAFLAFNSVNREGIFTLLDFQKDNSYNFSITAKGLGSSSTLMVFMCDGLTNANPDGTEISIPTLSNIQLVDSIVLNSTWQTFDFLEKISLKNFSQLWIFPIGGDMLVDDVIVRKSCCEPYRIWQNVTNPPSTYVNNFIIAGENVDSFQSNGKVIITNNSNLIEFQAGQVIELLPGFETEVGANFIAEVRDCGSKDFQIEINEIDPVILSYQEKCCFKKFSVSACFGSGNYSFSWDNGFGEDRTDFNTSNSSNISLNTPQWLFVTAVDLLSNDTIRKGIHIAQSPFFGQFPIDFANIITPNGDSLNDIWIAIDSTKLGKDSFGYNAYKFELSIYDRYGYSQEDRIAHSIGDNKIKGFAFDEIKWIDDYCNISNAIVYYGVLRLENCSQTNYISFTITLVCPSSEPFVLDISKEMGSTDLLLFPNPANSNFILKSKEKKIQTFKICNSLGLEIRKEANLYKLEQIEIDISSLAKGVYNVEIQLSDGSLFTKFLIKK